VRRSAVALAAIGAVTSVLASAGIAQGATKAHATSHASAKVVHWAEPPSATPNYIFPFMSSQFSTVNNISQFQYMLYRPLFMFGAPQNASPALDLKLSIGNQPTYTSSGTSATVTLKSYKWSNGETMSGADVLFFMNLLHAQKANFYAYIPGYFPDNVTKVTAGANSVTFTFNKKYNSTWITYNEFGTITPLPKAWDVAAAGAAAGSGGCSSGAYGAAATDAACTKVYNYLIAQAKSVSSYSSSPLWSVVDGPYTIAASKGGSFSSSGAVMLVPNPSYSGPKKATLSVNELPFTTEDAEYNALLGGKLDVGFIPTQDLTKPTTSALKGGPNTPRLASNFYITPWVLFGVNYAVLKFTSTGDHGAAGKIFSQRYVRQALQSLVDQPVIIKKLLKGYGVPTYGPVPVYPPNPFVDKYEQSNPYPYSVSTAKNLLTSHGWKVVSGGTDTCVRPGTASNECGAGIPKGAQMNFTLAYPTGTLWQQQTMQIEQSAWGSVGIHITLAPGTFNEVVGNYAPPCKPNACTLEFGWWGGGWEYSPDYYPSGELLFATGAGSNSGNYSNATADQLIKATTATNADLHAYQDFMAKDLPVIWEPNADYQVVEIANKLQGVAPENGLATLFPEYWYFKK
jgi:peptide/nickel transport system substrate-binding protein